MEKNIHFLEEYSPWPMEIHLAGFFFFTAKSRNSVITQDAMQKS